MMSCRSFIDRASRSILVNTSVSPSRRNSRSTCSSLLSPIAAERLEEGRETCRSFGMRGCRLPSLRIQLPVPVAVAIDRTVAGLFVPGVADHTLDIDLHQQLDDGLSHAAQKVASAGFCQQLGTR
jgi:hypothetical protein